MHDAGRARELEHAADLLDERRRADASASERPSRSSSTASGREPLHREVRHRIARRRRAEHAHDVRRVDRTGDADLAEEALDVARIGEQLAAQQLDRARSRADFACVAS